MKETEQNRSTELLADLYACIKTGDLGVLHKGNATAKLLEDILEHLVEELVDITRIGLDERVRELRRRAPARLPPPQPASPEPMIELGDDEDNHKARPALPPVAIIELDD